MSKEVANLKEAITYILANVDVTKYRLAKELNLSTATHINNYLTGDTKKCRVEVYKAMHDKYDVLVEAYKDTPEYRNSIKEDKKEIKV